MPWPRLPSWLSALLPCVLGPSLLFACGDPGRPAAELAEPACRQLSLGGAPAPSSIVLIVNDAMRRDVMGSYGGAAVTPNFDAFARENLLFGNAVTQAPWTKPSVATLFTGVYPSQHRLASHPVLRDPEAGPGAEVLETDVLDDGFVTLAEVLRDGGLVTAAFVSNPWLDGRFGFAQGFERYDDSSAHWGQPGDAVVAAARAWLAGVDAARPYFLYLHLIDSHRPYGRLGPAEVEALRPRFEHDWRPVKDHAVLAQMLHLADGRTFAQSGLRASRSLIRAAYRKGVEDFDALLGEILATLSARPDWGRTAVIVTSDHGEALYRRGYGNHGTALFDAQAAVPLAARLPGVTPASGRVDCLVGLVDVLPTLCDYLGVTCPDGVAGWSFLAPGDAESGDTRRFLVTEGVISAPEHRSIRSRRWKLLYEPRGTPGDPDHAGPYRLYDLAADPGERHDLSHVTGAHAVFETLVEALPAAVTEMPAPPRRSAPLDRDLQQRLRELGYLGD